MWVILNKYNMILFEKSRYVLGGCTPAFERHVEEENFTRVEPAFVSTYNLFLLRHSMGVKRMLQAVFSWSFEKRMD